MFQAYGLYTHIRANYVRTALLLAGFVALLHALLFSLLMIFQALGGGSFDEIVSAAASQFVTSWPVAMLAALVWFGIAYASHHALISRATGALPVTKSKEPRLYRLLEELCISRGIAMPSLEVIETPALNAYAAGLSAGDYHIAVTRGLIDGLDDRELQAVLGHELTHIRNKDAQLMVVSVIFAGVFGFFGDLLIRNWDFPYGWSPSSRPSGGWGGRTTRSDDGGSDRDRRREGGGGGGALLAIVVAIAIILISWGLSTLIRFALSRTREYLADAGSVELTKDPDAMISALRKIGRAAGFDVPSRMEAFFIESPVRQRVSGFFDTHPSIASRIDALQRYAGGRDVGPVDPAAA